MCRLCTVLPACITGRFGIIIKSHCPQDKAHCDNPNRRSPPHPEFTTAFAKKQHLPAKFVYWVRMNEDPDIRDSTEGMQVAIAGATGFIGQAVVAGLLDAGDDVLVLTRRPSAARRLFQDRVKVIEWRPDYDPVWADEIEGYDAVINLAGAPIFGRRWTKAQKERLLKSRTDSAEAILKAIRRVDRRPETLINASAIGLYGPHGDEKLDEDTPPGDDFLANVVRAWEEEVEDDDTESVRTIRLRQGIVLGKGGGILPQLVSNAKMFIGGPVGSGNQWVSWIHRTDVVRLILWALRDPRVEGPLNATAPEPVTNRELMEAIRNKVGRPAPFPTPAFMVRLVFGEAADSILHGQRVIPQRAEELGFQFTFPTLDTALADLL